MMNAAERETAIAAMHGAVHRFYLDAIGIGHHPFIEFAGVMTAYVKSCERVHRYGVDFSQCNRHTGRPLPIADFELYYLAEKLGCIFDGRIRAAAS